MKILSLNKKIIRIYPEKIKTPLQKELLKQRSIIDGALKYCETYDDRLELLRLKNKIDDIFISLE